MACCHGVKDHHGDGPWIEVTCCPGVRDHQDDGSWIIRRAVPYHGSEDTMGGEGWWRPTMGPAELDAMVGLREIRCAQPWVQQMLDTMVGGVACCHGVKDHHGDGPWIKVTCCHGVKDHHDDGSWIDDNRSNGFSWHSAMTLPGAKFAEFGKVAK